MASKPLFFATPGLFRAWLVKNHASRKEALIGFHKKSSGKKSLTWPQAVEQALCFGWTDGVRRSLDETSYVIRFTPRKPRSTWSLININLVKKLTKKKLMKPAGLAAFERRTKENSGIYSFEQKARPLSSVYRRKLNAIPKASKFFESQAPWYQRTASWWVMSAKREVTRASRLKTLVSCSKSGRTIPMLTRKPKTR